MNPLLQSLIGFRDKFSGNGETADSAMRGLNITDAMVQGTIGFERLRRLAQGKKALLATASKIGGGYAKKVGPVGLLIEGGNAAWLASDAEKRARVEAEYSDTAKKPAAERMIEGALNATDTLYATGKAVYDTGKTLESIQRSQMDEVNNDLLRKIAAHEAKLARERKPPSVNTLADMVTSSINLKPRTRP